MGHHCISTRVGHVAEVLEAVKNVEDILKESGVTCKEKLLTSDKEWLNKLLGEYIQIGGMRVVKRKPADGNFLYRRFYFDVYLVKRFSEETRSYCSMLYLRPYIQKKKR